MSNKAAKVETEQVDEEFNKKIEELEKVQEKIEKINKDASEEIVEIEKKYAKKKQPIYAERQKVIAKIEDFWPQALIHHGLLSNYFIDSDIEILKSLKNVEVEESDDLKKVKITFTFDKNDFLENTTLTKEINFENEEKPEVKTTKLKWKKTKKEPKKEEGGKNKKKRQHEEEDPEEDSFFKWFEIEETDEDDPILTLIRDEIWPNPLRFFLNTEEDDEGVEFGGSDDEGDNDDDDDQ
eukprot:GEZU01035792.1.p2 GENE.GEZU01035792.1~~GEZU01035792.1.p2  ORF type:complete len:238 (+),score=163.42 GEZU01035792.1:47-760(+)